MPTPEPQATYSMQLVLEALKLMLIYVSTRERSTLEPLRAKLVQLEAQVNPSKPGTDAIWCDCDAPLWPIAGNIGCTPGACARIEVKLPKTPLEDFAAIGVLQLAQSLRMQSRGAVDEWALSTRTLAVAYLQQRIIDWKPSPEGCARVDDVVREYIKAVLIEIQGR